MAFVGVDVPSGLMEVPELVVDLAANLGGELLKEGRSRLPLRRSCNAIPKELRHLSAAGKTDHTWLQK